jgi:iron complex transport system substrate-binding protein
MRETSHPAPSRSTRAKGFLLVAALLAIAACNSGATQATAPNLTPGPTAVPTPTQEPTAEPSAEPTAEPTVAPTATPAETPAFPLTIIDDEGTELTLEAEPERVVSLTPATTELLFALGDGEKVVGRTEFDNYPPEVVDIPAVAAFTGVLIEQVVDLEPDLVIAGGNNFTAAGDVQRMRDLGIPVMVVYGQDLDGVMADIELVGQAVGSEAEAEEITAQIQERIDEVTGAVAELEHPSVLYEIGYGPEIYAPAPDSFVADMVNLAGGEAITTSDPVAFSISLEELVTADPEVIILGDAAYPPPVCPDAVGERPGWEDLTAVVNGEIRPVNDIIVTSPGPRIGEGLAALALAIHPDAQVEPPAEGGATLCDV